MSTLVKSKMQWLELAVVATLIFGGFAASAAEMTKEEFFQLIGGHYHVTGELAQQVKAGSTGIAIVEREGEIYLENSLFTNTKTSPAIYKAVNIVCYNHSVPSTSCDFQLELVDMGSFAHFLGIHPQVRVDRFTAATKLEIHPDFELAQLRVPAVVVERDMPSSVVPIQVNAQLNILTNLNGMTAYTFDLDKPGVSNCNGACAQEWPPILVAEGDVAAPYSVVIRKDQTRQIAYNGKPLYLYAEDSQPGDLNGDGYSAVWHTAHP